MRIGLVIRRLDPRRGGAEQWTWQYARWLAARAHEVHVLAASVPAAAAAGLDAVTHQLRDHRSRTSLAAAAERQLRALELDIVHDMGVGWHWDVLHAHAGCLSALQHQKLRALASWQRPAKRCLVRLLPRYRAMRQLTRRQLANSKGVVVVPSDKVAREFERSAAPATTTFVRLYNGVDTQRFSPLAKPHYRSRTRELLGIRPEETCVLAVAHQFRIKGVPALVQAVGMLRQEGHAVRLVVAGGKPGSRWRGAARRRGALLLGTVADTAPLYAAADVFAHPTLYDACSLATLEALASGLPVITSRGDGASELLDDEVHGYILRDPRDPSELTGRLRQLLDPQVRCPLGVAARARAETHSWDRQCLQLLELYEQQIGKRASGVQEAAAGIAAECSVNA